MSFNISFAARTIHGARRKVAEASAPEAVKALIEKALDALPPLLPLSPLKTEDASCGVSGVGQSSAVTSRGVNGLIPAREKPTCFGVTVEVSGHVANPEDGGQSSEISKFSVRPLFD